MKTTNKSPVKKHAHTFNDYLNDKRVPCRLSRSCENPDNEHWKNFKHPPLPTSKTRSRAGTSHEPLKTSQRTVNPQNKSTHKDFIKQKFLVAMPEDFWSFWDFCRDIDANKPEEALKPFGLTLVGPFDVLGLKFVDIPEKTPEEYLLHWRYYYDPPEFQTVLKGSEKGFHIGYFRDDPKEMPSFVGSNYADTDGVIETVGDNLFAAVYAYLEDHKNTSDPFAKLNIPKILTKIKLIADKENFDLNVRSEKILKRERKILTRSLNKAGLIVPYTKKTQQGYRPLPMSNKDLKQLLTKLSKAEGEERIKGLMSQLQPVITAAMIATDEMDLGTGIELGWDILCFGIDSLNSVVQSLLCSCYLLLKRNEFAEICRAHMSNRKKGCNLSVL